jgi:hypothetical protein
MYMFNQGDIVEFTNSIVIAEPKLNPYDGEPIVETYQRNLITLGFDIGAQYRVHEIILQPKRDVEKGSASHSQLLWLVKISDGVRNRASVPGDWLESALALAA